MNPYVLGHVAAIATAACWSVNSLFFMFAGKRVGSSTVTHVRLWLAMALMLALHLVLFGTWFPVQADAPRILWLSLSGLVGFVFGDLFLFEAFVLIGARRALLVKTLAPALAAVLGWVFLHEKLNLLQIGGMAATLAGIALVVGKSKSAATRGSFRGVVFAFLGALGQALGVIFSKFGLSDGFSPISATLIRVAAGLVGIVAVTMISRKFVTHFRALSDRRAAGAILAGTILGPVIGVSLSLYAIQTIPVGVASTMMEMAPVFLIPISALLFGEKISARDIVGTLIAVGGAALLFAAA